MVSNNFHVFVSVFDPRGENGGHMFGIIEKPEPAEEQDETPEE